MNYKEGYKLLTQFVVFNVFISLILFMVNLILILGINESLFLSEWVYILLGICLPMLEIIRLMLMFFSGILTLRIKEFSRRYKAVLISKFVFGILGSLIFLIRLLRFACFVPAFSFSTMVFIYISFAVIIIHKDNT
ncbi:MAG: hypothetical protein ACFFEN_01155 [Candidatus Thorarchaeota archaeon]